MIVKLIAPGIIPNDYVTVDLQGVPHRGDTVLVETPTTGGEHDEELLTVLGVCWPVEIMLGILHHGVSALPEVTLGRTPDAFLTQHSQDGLLEPESVREHLAMQRQTHTR